MQVQGSGRVRLTDGSWVRLGYAGQERPLLYLDRQAPRRARREPPQGLTMDGLKGWLRADPARGRALMHENTSYVFFRELPEAEAGEGPVGAQGVPLTPGRSLAVDTAYHALGTPIFVDGARSCHAGGQALPAADDRAGRGLGDQGPGARRHFLGLGRRRPARSPAAPSTRRGSSSCCRSVKARLRYAPAHGQARHRLETRCRAVGAGGAQRPAAREGQRSRRSGRSAQAARQAGAKEASPPAEACAEAGGRSPLPPRAARRSTGRRRGSSKAGDFPVEARLDLHGMRQRDAHAALRRFLKSAQGKGYRHVLVITGKGAAARRATKLLRGRRARRAAPGRAALAGRAGSRAVWWSAIRKRRAASAAKARFMCGCGRPRPTK